MFENRLQTIKYHNIGPQISHILGPRLVTDHVIRTLIAAKPKNCTSTRNFSRVVYSI